MTAIAVAEHTEAVNCPLRALRDLFKDVSRAQAFGQMPMSSLALS
jgi:hypothetical protein